MADSSALEPAVSKIADHFHSKPGFSRLVGGAIRRAIDEVIDGPRSGRWSIDQLEKTEKTYIGTKIEMILRYELELERGKKLDALICGHEVDIKWSLDFCGWMIPKEAMGEIVLGVWADDSAGRFGIGVVRITSDLLTTKEGNRDKKKQITAGSRKKIRWLIGPDKGVLPSNFMLELDPIIRDRVISKKNGQARIRELFKSVVGRAIPRYAVATVAQQKDGLRRARGEIRKQLLVEGFVVLCGTWLEHRARVVALGLPSIGPEDFLVLKEPPSAGPLPS